MDTNQILNTDERNPDLQAIFVTVTKSLFKQNKGERTEESATMGSGVMFH